MKYFLLVLFLVNISANESKIKYDGYTVYRLIPFTNEQLEALKLLGESDNGFDFWTYPTTLNQPVDIMVPPRLSSAFKKLTKNLQLNAGVFIPDVQNLIKETFPETKPEGSFAFDWTTYYRLADIYAWMDSLAQQYPTKVKVVVAGKSFEGRDIKGVKVSLKSGNKAVFIEGGIHAREWISPATVTYILNQLLTSTSATVTAAAKNYDWYFFPVFNPDGYEYTFTNDRLWRKTRKPHSIFCKGTDANRNWGYHWMNGGSSTNPCSDLYAGPSAFSEPETKALSNFITSIQSNLIGYIAFHSYSQLILLSYGDSPAHVENYNELFDIGTLAASSLAQRYGTNYTVGNIVEVLYIASGTSMDWAKGTYHKPITFTFELRDKGKYGFLLPADQIVPSGEETLDAFVTIIQQAKTRGY